MVGIHAKKIICPAFRYIIILLLRFRLVRGKADDVGTGVDPLVTFAVLTVSSVFDHDHPQTIPVYVSTMVSRISVAVTLLGIGRMGCELTQEGDTLTFKFTTVQQHLPVFMHGPVG